MHIAKLLKERKKYFLIRYFKNKMNFIHVHIMLSNLIIGIDLKF